jgi:hypothetical protein
VTDDKRVAEYESTLATYCEGLGLADYALSQGNTEKARQVLSRLKLLLDAAFWEKVKPKLTPGGLETYIASGNSYAASLDATTARLREAEGLLRRARQRGALSFEDMREIGTFLKGANNG